MQFIARLAPLLVLLSIATMTMAVEPLPTAAEVRKDFAEGKYRDVVKSVTKIIATRDWQAKKPDGYELLNLKAESHFRLKENPLAVNAFDAAAKLAPDALSAATARTTAVLIRKSTGIHYAPKAANQRVKGAKPAELVTIDILEPDARKQALAALWQDEKDAAQAAIDAATGTDNKSMQAVLDATPMVAHLRDYDLAAHGNDEMSKKIAGEIAAHGRDLLTEMIEKLTIRLDVVAGKANEVEKVKMQGGDRWKRHGLEDREPAELKEIEVKADKIAAAVKVLSQGLSTDDTFFERLSTTSFQIHNKVEKTLNVDTTPYLTRETAARE
ncbi:MAG TPA: hypothetical protein VG326_17250 [Tepidisphaeraceae bacterium]|jgi:hypothetical protein|nr:hypothetical protein [Tepidisphaeraceae bacterium]